jgi:hypothetical protein
MDALELRRIERGDNPGVAALYEKAGFARIDRPLGSTGHCGCDRWYVKTL